MESNHEKFLSYVKSYVSSNPEVSAYVSTYVAEGINVALSQTKQRALDMESALLSMMTNAIGSKKKSLEYAKEKILKWKGKLCFSSWNVLLEDKDGE